MKDNLKSMGFALGAAFIWGIAFVAQSDSTAPAFIFNATRSWIAVPFLMAVILIVTKGDIKHLLREDDAGSTGDLWLGGALMGAALFAATFLQQHGMDLGTSSGKAGFITALYMILVPIGGLFLGKKTGINIWIAALIAIAGLYFLCIGDSFTVQVCDLYVLGCSLCFMVQILLIDHYSPKCNCVKLSCVQFIFCALFSTLGALIFNREALPELGSIIRDNIHQVHYLGICSSGIAYTLQMQAQKGGNPTAVSIIMSTESVFSVIAGLIIKHDVMPFRSYMGCALMLCAVLITQLDFSKLFRKKA